jgi:tRNA threonylcarbamoyladenosine biosynthesis protein TsaB
MALILSIETSTTVCSAALHKDGRLVSLQITHEPNSAASQLAVMIDNLLNQSGNPDAVAVSSGPGSYTGLRIGVATAKGICYGLNIPLISVNSLELMALEVVAAFAQHSTFDIQHSLFCPMIDARRMEVYTMLLDSNMNVVSPIEAKVIDSSSFADKLQGHEILFFGNGAMKCEDTITHPNARFIEGIFPSAEWMGGIAFDLYQAKKFEDVSDFEPLYLKDFIAKKPKSLV